MLHTHLTPQSAHLFPSHRIVYRDLKPDNIGFDATGCLKLFDFGFCRRLSDLQPDDDDLYKLTGRTGTVPYMAPEVDMLQRYNSSCDVYSFSIVLWEMLALDFSFSGILTHEAFLERVSKHGERPLLQHSWPTAIQRLLRECWQTSPNKRPSFATVRAVLKEGL